MALTYRDMLWTKIEAERRHQDRKWGGLEHDKTHSSLDWARIVCDLAIKAANEDQDGAWDYSAERAVIQVAATAIAWLEARAASVEHLEGEQR